MLWFLIPGGLAVCTAVWTAIASAAALAMIGQMHLFQPPYWQWWELRPYWSTGPWPMFVVWVSGGVAFAPFAIAYSIVLASWRAGWNTRMQPSLWWLWQSGRVQRGITDNYGNTCWMSVAEMCRRFHARKGVPVGEAYRPDQDLSIRAVQFDPRNKRTWGKGGKRRLLIHDPTDGPGHSVVFAGSRKYKTTTAVTTILSWVGLGSCVVLDPSCELAPMLTDELRKRKQAVYVLSPEASQQCNVNVLDWINPKDPMAAEHIQTVVSWIWHDEENRQTKTAEDNLFEGNARNLVACFLAHLVWDCPNVPRTLETVREWLASPEPQVRAALQHILDNSNSKFARQRAAELVGIVHETFSGMLFNVAHGTSWLSTGAYAQLVSGSTFDTRALRKGNVVVFIQVSLDALMNQPAVARTLIGSLMNSVYQAKGNPRLIAGRVLFLLDEAALLGPMRLLQTVGATGSKYRLHIHMLYQSVGQFEKQWGSQGKKTWYDNLSWRGYAAMQDLETAEEVSKLFGYNTVMAFAESDNTGSGNIAKSLWHNTNRREERRALILPQDLLQNTRHDVLYGYAGGRPFQCSRAIYFRRPEIASVVNLSAYA